MKPFQTAKTKLPAKLVVFVSAFILLSMAVACSREEKKARLLKLPSGRDVTVLGVVEMRYPQGDPALMLKYETSLKVSDRIALRKEAEEVWHMFRPDVEKAGYTGAILSANEAPRGLIFQKSNGYNFVYEKGTGGIWRCLNDHEAESK